VRGLKARLDGEIEVAGPELAGSLTELGLIDEYRLYLRPIVLGHGKPFFIGPRASLRLVASDRLGENTIRLTYVPAKSCNSGPLWGDLSRWLAGRNPPFRIVRVDAAFNGWSPTPDGGDA